MRKIVLFFIGFVIYTNINAQIWELKDSRPNGDISPLRMQNGIGIVDVSSLVFIDLKKDSIRFKISDKISKGENLQVLLDKALTLQKISAQGLSMISGFSQHLESLNNAKTEQEKIVIIKKAYGQISGLALNIILVAENNPVLYDKLDKALQQSIKEGGGAATQYQYVFSAVQEYAKELKTDLDKVLKDEGVYLQMAATLFTQSGLKTPIHFDDFDNFSTPEFYDPYALNLALTNSQKEQLKFIDSLSKRINKEGIQNTLKHSTREFKTKTLDPILLDLEKCMTDLVHNITIIAGSQVSLSIELKNELSALKLQIDNSLYLLRNLKVDNNSVSEYSRDNLWDNLNQLQVNFSKIKSQSLTIRHMLTELGQGLPTSIQRIVDDTESQINGCGKRNIEKADSVIQLVSLQVTGFRTLSQISSLVVEFSDEVIKHSIDNLPEKALMDIKNRGGVRDEGDNIVLEFRAGKPGTASVLIDRQYFTLMKTQPYLRMDVGLIFVNELRENNKGKFQAAPAASILFKFGTRGKSTFYRKFLDFGIGINTSTLNFDPDKDLEMGLAFVATAFRDYIQSGIGYNLSAGSPYFFVGARIPFLNKDFSFSDR